MVQANPFEAHQQQLAASHVDEPMSENCIRARKWIAEQFQPVICVFSSKATQKRMLDVNGITPAEFLRPFGEVGNLSNYLVRTCDRNIPYKLNRFRVNFIDSHLMSDHPKPSDRIPERIINENKPKVRNEMANIAINKESKEAINANLMNLIGANRQATERMQTPWFTQMKKHLLQSNRFAQHELTQQPIAFIYFLSVEDQDPLNQIERLRAVESLPKQYRTGIYDNTKIAIKNFVLVLNDQPHSTSFTAIKDQLATQFASGIIHEIKMSASASAPAPQQDIWEKYLDLDLRAFDKTANRVKQLGCSFTTNDRTLTQQIIRKIIEKTLLPFAVQRIQIIEQNIAKTRKGISKFMRIFKTTERNENDGIQSNFRMNKQEIELRTLVDLSFVIQDYETTYTNAQIPAGDFKGIKAYLHAAHCDELRLYARLAHEKFYAQNNMKDVIATSNGIYEMYQKSQNPSQSMIRFSLMMGELLQSFKEHEHAAFCYIRVANKLADKAILKAMCYEQAAYEYLMLEQYRKFSYYMTLAGQSYERMGQVDLKNYSFNCFTIVHPFYQARKGWNTIQYQLYSLLGANCEFAEGNSHLAVQFFRNLLLLTHQFNDINQQRQCLTASLQAFRKFQSDAADGDEQSSALGSHIGYLELPEILPHTIEVFTDHEKVLTNLRESKVPIVPGGSYSDNQGECNLIEQKFINFNGFYKDESAAQHAQKEASAVGNQIVHEDINQSNIPWRILQKQVTDFMRRDHMSDLQQAKSEAAVQINGDEMTECGIYDAISLKDRTDTTYKRQRKVFKDKAIRVRFILRNPLLTDINITNLRLCCRYLAEEGKEQEEEEESKGSEELEAEQIEMQLPSQEQVEVILKVVPKKTGKLIIEQIRWELYDIFKCEYDLVKTDQTRSDVRPEFRSTQPRQLLEKEKIFSYEVMESSAEISAKVELEHNGSLPRLGQQSRLVFSETDSGTLSIKNLSKTHTVRNIFLLCSHPIIFDMYIKRIMRDETSGEPLELKPEEEFKIPVNFRATIKGELSVRFLFRYEVAPLSQSEPLPATCRFRFQRMVLFINSQCLFSMTPNVLMSVRQSDQFIVNLMTAQRLNATWYERPQVSSIEALNGARHWQLSKKDEFGNFFMVKPREQSLNDSVDEIPGAQLGYLRQNGDHLLEGIVDPDVDSLTKDKVAFTFFQREAEHMENISGSKWRKTSGPAEKEQIDLVVRWSMPQNGKSGFITLFGVELLKDKKHLTTQATKILEAQQLQAQKAIRQSMGLESSRKDNGSTSRRVALSQQKVMPIKVTFDFEQHIQHHFTSENPSKMVKLVLNIQNKLQSDQLGQFECHIMANQSWKKGKGRYSLVDVSEGESFLWVGKTTFKLQDFKYNETKKVTLRANLPRQGLFNLNRFNIIVKQVKLESETTGQSEMLQGEYRVRDSLIVQVDDPIGKDNEDSDQLSLHLIDGAFNEFSK